MRPVGTQIVVHESHADGAIIQGSVGRIVRLPQDGQTTYRIRFMNGIELELLHEAFSVRSHYNQPDLSAEHNHDDLYQYVIYRCVMGSRAYGLDHADSDTDRRGIYLPPADLHWSMAGVPEQLENRETEETYWEIEKFIRLALKANPNILECLYSPLVEYATPLAESLIDQREMFLSRLIYQTYNGYVMSQFKKLQKDIENHGEIRWKHATHLIRLLLSGIAGLKEGSILVRMEGTHRERLLEVRHGEMPWEMVNQWRLQLHTEFDAAFQTTLLPERPDYEQANTFLIEARRSAVD